MGLENGSLACRRFRHDQPFEGSRDDLLRRLNAAAFEPLQAHQAGPREGWVRVDNLLETEFHEADVFLGPYARFQLRSDERKPPTRLVRALVERELVGSLEAEGRQQPRPRERREIQEAVVHRLLPKCLPTPTLHEITWDIQEHTVYLFSISRKATERVRAQFLQTFGLTLFSTHPARLAAEQGGTQLLGRLSGLSYSFGESP